MHPRVVCHPLTSPLSPLRLAVKVISIFRARKKRSLVQTEPLTFDGGGACSGRFGWSRGDGKMCAGQLDRRWRGKAQDVALSSTRSGLRKYQMLCLTVYDEDPQTNR